MRLAKARGLRLPREPWIVLIPLLLVQWAALAAFALVVRHNGWLYYQGGDQTFFYTDSWVLGHGHIPQSRVGYAWSLVLVPFTWLFGPSFLSALPALIVLQTVVLLPIALLAMYGIGARLGGRSIGYLAAVLWVVVPYLSIPLFVHRYHQKFVEQFLPQSFGLTGLGDFPSTVCLVVAAYFVVRALDTRAWTEGALAGLATGFAIGIKPANALFLAGPALALVAARRWREGAAFAGALAPPVLALLLWKARGLGYVPILTPSRNALAAGAVVSVPPAPLAVVVSRYLNVSWHTLYENFLYLREVFWSVRLVQWLPIAGFLAIARLSLSKALLIGSWFAAFVVVKSAAPGGSLEEGTLLRLIMPGFPALVLLTAAIPILAPTVGPKIAARFPCRTRPLTWRRPSVIAAAVLVAIVPLAILGVLTPLPNGQAATLSASSVYIPAQGDIGLRGGAQGAYVNLFWRPQRAGATRSFYTVYRAPARFKIPKGSPDQWPTVLQGLLCQRHHPSGAVDCSLEVTPIVTTRKPEWVDHPPKGHWTYRIGVTANWLDNTKFGDTMLMSSPLTVTVH